MFEAQKAKCKYENPPRYVSGGGAFYIKIKELLQSRRFYEILEKSLKIRVRKRTTT